MAVNEGYVGDGFQEKGMSSFQITDNVEPLDDVSRKEAMERDRSPLWNCRLIVAYPKTCFLLTLFLHLASVFTLFILLVPGYDILPTDVGEVYIDVRGSDDFLRRLAWQHRNDHDDVIKRVARQQERSEIGEALEFHFECQGCNVFTTENMESMKEAQEKLQNATDFKEKYCYKIRLPVPGPGLIPEFEEMCSPPVSILGFFDGSVARLVEDERFYDPTFNNISYILNLAKSQVNNSIIQDILDNILPKDYTITPTETEAEIIRGFLFFGLPLEGYITDQDRRKKQDKKVIKYLEDTFGEVPEELYKEGAGELSFYYTSRNLFFEFFDYIIYQDMYFIIGSFSFIFLFILLQTWSLFVTVFTAGSLLTTFCITNLIYRFVFDYQYFGNIHFLVVFVVLGIGVDDIFIFTNTWKHTGCYQYKSLAHRLSDCYRRTAIPMLFTSITTILSFCISISSQLMTISTLAVFGALYMFVIFASVVVFFPTVMVMYHLYFEKYAFFIFMPRSDWDKETNDFKKPSKPNIFVRFFKGPYHRFVTNPVCAGFILVAMAGLMAVFVYYSTTVEINIDLVTVNPFKDTTNFGKFLQKRDDLFPKDDNTVKIHLMWGLENQDLSDCHFTDPECWGDTVWDKDFDLSPVENQRALMDLCSRIRDMSEKEIDDLHIKTNENGEPEVLCFLDDMQSFYTAPLQDPRQEPGRIVCDPPSQGALRPRYNFGNPPDLSLPVTEAKATTVMDHASFVYDSSVFNQNFSNWFEIGLSHWLYGGWPTLNVSAGLCVPALSMWLVPMLEGMPTQFRQYDDLIGETETPYTQSVSVDSNPTLLGLDFKYRYGTKLRYAAIVVTTTLDNTLQYGKGLPIRDKWEEFMEDQLKDMPKGLKNGFQATPETDIWHLLQAQKALITASWIGIGVGLAAVLLLLVIGTLNFVTSILTTLVLACTVAVVIGFLALYGSNIDLFETVVLTLVVGVSADYSIHMALAYSRSAHPLRRDRVKDALEGLGLSVTSGVLTTLGSCLFMFFAVLTFFPRFAGILFISLGFSWLASILFLPCLLGLFGPERNFASCKCCCDDDTPKHKSAMYT